MRNELTVVFVSVFPKKRYSPGSLLLCLLFCGFLWHFDHKDVAEGHDIVPDGYDIGRYVHFQFPCDLSPSTLSHYTFYRDKLVAAAVGESSYLGTTYTTVVEAIPNLLAAGSQGINHGNHPSFSAFFTVPIRFDAGCFFIGIAQDGIVKMLTVTIEGWYPPIVILIWSPLISIPPTHNACITVFSVSLFVQQLQPEISFQG